MNLYFILTEVGWIEAFYQKDQPVYNDRLHRFTGRMVHPFGFRDAVMIQEHWWRINQPYGFGLKYFTEPSRYQLHFVKTDVNRMEFRRRLELSDMLIEVFCERLVHLFRSEKLPLHTKISLIQLPIIAPQVVV